MSGHVEALLPEFVLGGLRVEERDQVHRHVEECAACAVELRALDETFAAVGLAEAPVEPSPELWERIAASTARGRLAAFAAKVAELLDLTLERAERVLELADEPASWGPLPVPGADGISLYVPEMGPRVAGGTVGFLKLRPGARFPMHRHQGPEWVLTVQGGYRDESDGKEWGPGDVQTMDPETAHSFVGVDGPDCICLGVVLGAIDIEGVGIPAP